MEDLCEVWERKQSNGRRKPCGRYPHVAYLDGNGDMRDVCAYHFARATRGHLNLKDSAVYTKKGPKIEEE